MNKHIFFFVFYALVVVAVFFARPFTFRTDIMDIAPTVREDPKVTETLDRLSRAYTNRVNILFGARDLREAKDAGLFFKDRLADQPIKTVFLLDEGGTEILDLLSKYNHRLLSENTAELLENGEYSTVRDKALSMLYGPVNVGVLPLEQDPFLLATDFMMNLGLTKTNFSPSQGVLTANRNEVAYAYMTLELNSFSPSYLLPVIEEIKRVEASTLEKFSNVSINISGVPLHSARAISKSVLETNIIGGVSILLVLLISFAVFRSFKCFLYAMLTILTSVALAFMLSTLIFGEVHILVIVFGVCLIGLCIDYHLHYFAERGVTDEPWLNIGRAVGISLATSMTGFAVTLFSGVPILFHMAIFALLGLANTYYIIRFFYPPLLRKSAIRTISPAFIRMEKHLASTINAGFKKYFPLKIGLIIIVSSMGILQIKPADDLRNLYKPEKSLLGKEAFFAEIAETASAPLMIVVKGINEQDTLEKEEQLRRCLNGFDYRSVSQALPSFQKQEKNYALQETLYKHELDAYLATIGTPQGVKEKMKIHLLSQKDRCLTLAEMPEALKPLHTGESSVIVIENAQNKKLLAQLAEEHGAFYSDRFQEISQTLKKLRVKASFLCALTFALVFCALTYIYKSPRRAFLMVAPSLMSVLLTLGIMGFTGMNVSLFDILALFLVVCFGVDYVVFRVERGGREDHTGTIIALSCLTTIVSFGALGLTSFAVTRALGLSLSMGLIFSYILSPLATRSLLKEES